tara:strand:+ start:4123 stop:5967 length:1845 start_codon:yes stop_codon:yes gene_type:complete
MLVIRVFDIETDGLDPTLIHVVSWSDDMGQPKSTHDYEEMRSLFTDGVTLCGHNIIRYDIPAVEKILGIEVKSRLIDTLGLSWYLNYWKPKHGLAEYGVEYGVPKPKIDDWENLDKEEYRNRCEQDVRINQVLWKNLDYKLSKLYKETEDKDRLIDYLSFKLKCAATQEYLQWKLDVAKAVDYRDEWLELKSNKIELLADAMPKKVLTTVRNQPKVYHKKDGSISSKGQEWEDLCREQKQPATTKSLTVITGYERANPNSVDQVKDWLFSLGWTPRTFKFLRDKATGETRELEQVRKDSDLCDSVKELSGVEPAINLLDGLSVLTHRIGVISGMIDKQKDGYVKASIAGLTNTLRFKHAKPLVNLPSVDKPYGSEIRGCLTCPDDMILCGADMTSLEDTTKRHYMKPLDPDYVEEMSKEGFDPHLDLAKHAGVISQEDIDNHNSGVRSLKSLRKNYKVVNYSATYGVGAPTLSRNTGMPRKDAQKLLDAFWSRNWSVEEVASKVKTKQAFDGMWLQNPVSKFWYSLRSEKDRFSTLNQGTGVFCFDSWVKLCVEQGIHTVGQFHDEVIAVVEKGKEQETKVKMVKAIDQLNDNLKLNVPLGVDAQFGKTYADIH